MKQGAPIHFIAIGGSVMHNLALELQHKGYKITGSDDEIFDPAKERLAQAGILPPAIGWFPEKIHDQLEAVIVGMHARADNPELLKAKELNLPVYSFPEFIYQQSIDKHRLVVGGSHGKTTITAMIMHVLKGLNRKFDYVIGAAVEGFTKTVSLSDESPTIVIEGDEYFTSPLDPTPKFLHYHHHIGVISGIAWDHINVFPNLESYVAAFEHFAEATPKGGALVYSQDDALATVIGAKERPDVARFEYEVHPYKIVNHQYVLVTPKGDVPVQVFGEHNMKNINAAKLACARIDVEEDEFYAVIGSFKGAANRLTKLGENSSTVVFKDFAHAPSKLAASTEAVKELYENRHLIGCLELHSFSSLSKPFLKQYKGKFNAADTAVVYFNPKTIAHKKLEPLHIEDIKEAFKHKNLLVFDDSTQLLAFLQAQDWKNKSLLMMSSGNFDGIDFQQLTQQIIH